jgi:hypothetical protein
MRRVFYGGVLAALLAAGVGCSGQSDPPQPKLSDEQVKAAMKKGAEQRERGDTRGGLGPRGK